MSRDVRAALEAAQARVGALQRELGDRAAGEHLAAALHREADALEATLTRGERQEAASVTVDQGSRLAAFGFMVLFVMPIVGMVGFTAGQALRHQPVASVALLLVGFGLLGFVFISRVKQRLQRRLSRGWKLVRAARAAAEALSRALTPA